MSKTAIVPVAALTQLAERWEKQAAEHGVRQFTGNDHMLFANELRAAMVNARPPVPDELIEEAAKAMFYVNLNNNPEYWTRYVDDDVREHFRNMARAAARVFNGGKDA